MEVLALPDLAAGVRISRNALGLDVCAHNAAAVEDELQVLIKCGDGEDVIVGRAALVQALPGPQLLYLSKGEIH